MNSHERFSSLRTGLLEFLVLKIIAAQQVYAADVLQELAKTAFKTQEGTLYPLLSKLRRDELLGYEWRESEAGPPRKYYSLTPKGETHLQDLKEYWQALHQEISTIGK